VEESRKALAKHRVTIAQKTEESEDPVWYDKAPAGPGAAPPAGERGGVLPGRKPREAEQPARERPARVRVEDDGPGIDAADLA